MEVILIQRVAKLGEIGDLVNVKNGFARNFLIPQEKAIRATEANKNYYDAQKVAIIAENKNKKQQSEKLVDQVPESVILIRQAAEDNRLFGSVNARDIANAINQASSLDINKNYVLLNQVVKYIGIYTVNIQLHPEVTATLLVNVSRSEDEAKHALANLKKKVEAAATKESSSEEEATA